jgi:NEDD8-activating enzyme E1 regulatory subunit
MGSWLTYRKPIESFIAKPGILLPYSLIIATAPLAPEILSTLSQHASDSKVPLFYVHSIGFYSAFSVQLPPVFPIVDTHPDPATILDLRLLKPWPALVDLAKEQTAGLTEMDDHRHGHVPFALLLLHYLEEWKASHDGKVPDTYKEKTAFRDLVSSGIRRNNAEGGEENFDEAVAAVLKTITPPKASSSVREVLETEQCQNLTKESTNFWVIANAISHFYNTNGVLPVPGSVPDMKATSAGYIQLQNTYKQKAREDFTEVLKHVRKTESLLGRKPVDEREVENFCKGAGHIKMIRGRPIQIVKPGETPAVTWSDRPERAVSALSDPTSLILLYIAFLAFDIFCSSHPNDGFLGSVQAPGSEDPEVDGEKLVGIAYKIIDDLIKEAGTAVEDPEYSEAKEGAANFAKEIARAGGAELHNIAALTGGIVAQEVIKVITRQYVPVDNTCLFDGVESKTAVLKV